jgi:hypothetical protein
MAGLLRLGRSGGTGGGSLTSADGAQQHAEGTGLGVESVKAIADLIGAQAGQHGDWIRDGGG